MQKTSKSCGIGDELAAVRPKGRAGASLRNPVVGVLLAAATTFVGVAASASAIEDPRGKGCGIDLPDGPMCRLG